MKQKQFLLLLIVSSLSMMVVGLSNGFPLTENDTGAYIAGGLNKIYSIDRTPFYGWFMRYTNFRTSLWLTIFAQCLILSYLILKYIKLIQNDIAQFNTAFATIITIISFTALPWVTCFLMPDIFAPILLLAIILYLSGGTHKTKSAIIYMSIIFVAIIVHNAHAVIVGLFSVLLLIWSLAKKYKPLIKRSIFLLIISGFSWLVICSTNSLNGRGFAYSRTGHVFMMGRLAETGILKIYLDNNCSKKNYALCQYKDQLPLRSWEFMWSSNGPFQKTGGWDSSATEYTAIIRDILTTPKYLARFIQKSAIGTLRELCLINPGNMQVGDAKGSSPGFSIGLHYPVELSEYLSSEQNNGGISASVFSYFYFLFFVLSSIWILLHPDVINKDLAFIYGFIILFLVVNAFVTSTFSTVASRFQNRVFWVLPATNAILLIRVYCERFRIANNV